MDNTDTSWLDEVTSTMPQIVPHRPMETGDVYRVTDTRITGLPLGMEVEVSSAAMYRGRVFRTQWDNYRLGFNIGLAHAWVTNGGLLLVSGPLKSSRVPQVGDYYRMVDETCGIGYNAVVRVLEQRTPHIPDTYLVFNVLDVSNNRVWAISESWVRTGQCVLHDPSTNQDTDSILHRQGHTLGGSNPAMVDHDTHAAQYGEQPRVFIDEFDELDAIRHDPPVTHTEVPDEEYIDDEDMDTDDDEECFFSSDKPEHQEPTPVVRPFSAQAWVEQLCSQTGVAYERIPEDKRAEMLAMPDKTGINQLFFAHADAWLKPDALTDEDEVFFTKLMTADHSQEVTDLKNLIRSHQTMITRKHNEINLQAMAIHEKREQLVKMKEASSIDLGSELQAIVKAGWYKYERERTLNYNKYLSPDSKEHAIIFTTPEVVIVHQNPHAGIDMKVNMGSFSVIYKPRHNQIKVFGNDNNLDIDAGIDESDDDYNEDYEYYHHPHVDNEGDVCWGNAAAVHSKAMVDYTPSKSFNALRTLLQTYNDESPYRDIVEFAELRDPKLLLSRPPVYQFPGHVNDNLSHRYAWFNVGELASEGIEVADRIRHDYDHVGDVRWDKLKLMRRYNPTTFELAPDTDNMYYLKLSSGRYHTLHKDELKLELPR